MMKPCPNEWLLIQTVSRKVNNMRSINNSAEILDKVKFPEIDYLSGTLF